MADAECAIFPPALRQASFFAEPSGVAEEDLAGDGEDFVVCEACEEWGQEIGFDSHVAVEEDYDVIGGGEKASVGAAAEA